MKSRFFKMATNVSSVGTAGVFTYLSATDHQRKYNEMQTSNPGKTVNCNYHTVSSYGGYWTYDVVDVKPKETSLQKKM